MSEQEELIRKLHQDSTRAGSKHRLLESTSPPQQNVHLELLNSKQMIVLFRHRWWHCLLCLSQQKLKYAYFGHMFTNKTSTYKVKSLNIIFQSIYNKYYYFLILYHFWENTQSNLKLYLAHLYGSPCLCRTRSLLDAKELHFLKKKTQTGKLLEVESFFSVLIFSDQFFFSPPFNWGQCLYWQNEVIHAS